MNRPSTRIATSKDIEAVAILFDAYRQFYAQDVDPQLATTFIHDRIEKNESVILVAENESSELLDFCQLYPTFCSVIAAPVCTLYDLYVQPEAQLARECEKRQRLELELTGSQPVAAKAKTKGSEVKVEPDPVPEAAQTGFNWRKVSNDELNGDRRHDAYHEKLRRSVEAIEEYNAGRDDSEQFAITGSLLRQLTKVKPGLVKEWMEAHEAELANYNAGYGSRQNTDKPAPRSVIKWSAVYGDYCW